MGADVARQVEELVGRKIRRRNTVEHLLKGWIGGLGRPTVLADQRLDRRAVDDVERMKGAGARVARIDGRRVDDEQVLDEDAQPVAKGMLSVGPREQRQGDVDLFGAGGPVNAHALADGEVLRRELVLARLDDGAQERQRIGERAQFSEADAAFRAGNIIEVRAERIVEPSPLHLGRRLGFQRLLRAEPGIGFHAGDGIARRLGQAGEDARGQRAFDGVRGHAGFLRGLG